MAGSKRYLGVDVGTKRVGVATGDSEAKLASPLATVPPTELLALIDREGPFDAIVVGLPRNLDGNSTPQTLAVRHWVDDVLGDRAEPIVWQDEAGTSSVAEAELEAIGKPYDRAAIDAHAAAIILQDYLDSL